MPVFRDFSENGKFLGERNEPINTQNLSRYIVENGQERAEGYYQAIADVLKQIDDFTHYQSGNRRFLETPAGYVRGLKAFVQERTEFLKYFNELKHEPKDLVDPVIDPAKMQP